MRSTPGPTRRSSAQGLLRAHEIAAAPGVSLGDDEVGRLVDDEVGRLVDDAFRVLALQSRHEQEPG